MSSLGNRPDRILITPLAFKKLKLYMELCPAEISGLGRLQVWKGELCIADVFILSQRVSPSETELDQEALLAFLAQVVSKGEDPSLYKVWWHSHGDLDLEWSETDEGTIETFGSDELVSVVGNRKGEFLCRIDRFGPLREVIDGLTLTPLEGGDGDQEDLRHDIEAELREKVRVLSVVRHSLGQEGMPDILLAYEVPLGESAAQPSDGGGWTLKEGLGLEEGER